MASNLNYIRKRNAEYQAYVNNDLDSDSGSAFGFAGWASNVALPRLVAEVAGLRDLIRALLPAASWRPPSVHAPDEVRIVHAVRAAATEARKRDLTAACAKEQ